MLKTKTTLVTTSKDKGAKHILAEIDKIGSGVWVDTGILQPQGSQLPMWKGEVQRDAPIAQYAWWNEVGTKTIPPRPAFAQGMTLNLKKYEKKTMAGMRSIYNGGGGINLMLDANAKSQKSWTKQSIRKFDSPMNSPITLKQKEKKGQGSSPLIASGSMLKAVSSMVFGKSRPKRNHLISLFKKTEKKVEKIKL
ncbi:MAG: hypothetical protein E2O82_03740 [Betaproteobacteria bacterium]|nr:MAG: hypothetical protein E2O82_03740 [Betaproteobacteria bacterium]